MFIILNENDTFMTVKLKVIFFYIFTMNSYEYRRNRKPTFKLYTSLFTYFIVVRS